MNWLNQNLILECLGELSDRQLQEDLWMGKIPSQQSSFVEAVEGLFTDSGLNDALSDGKTKFSLKTEIKLRELEQQLSKVHTNGGTAKIINSPEMSQVRELAAGALQLLKHEIK